METVSRFFADTGQSFFLFGPRGTGKSTWAQGRYPQALVVNLLDPEVYRSYAARPERLRELVRGNPARQCVVIDEVQRVPELLTVVHALIEQAAAPALQFILTGSSARKVRRAGVDLLAGRALLRHMHPFVAAELGDRFDLERALTEGMVPLVVAAASPEQTLRSYAALYVEQEVQMEGLVRNIGAFARFLEVVSFSHGSPLNVANIARECEAERNTVAGYLSILQDLLLAFQLPVFTRRAKRALAAHPKFYYFDTGVFRSLRPRGPLDRAEEIEGAALEGLVVQHLRAWNDYSGGRNSLSYWRTRSGVEVDVVVYGEDGLWGIEIKNTRRIDGRDLRALRSFADDYPEARLLFVYRGTERLEREGVLCLPCADFLRQLRPGRALA